MIAQRLSLGGFRNLRETSLSFSEGVNVFYGDNAQGKTNLLEAIWMFTGARSFRTPREKNLIAFGREQASLRLSFSSYGREQEAEITLGEKKSVLLNGVRLRSSSQLGESFKAVVFAPGHLSLVKDGPHNRRRFLDGALGVIKPHYRALLSAYGEAVANRNVLLRDIRFHSELLSMLEVYDRQAAANGARILHMRRQYVEALGRFAGEIYEGLSGGREKLAVSYSSEIEGEGVEEYLLCLKNHFEEDLKNESTGIGPHLDDILLTLDGIPARDFASQGQQRSIVIALKLAEAAMLRQATGEMPVALFDDVMSELDYERRNYILNHIEGWQVFITCCTEEILGELARGSRFLIRAGTVLPEGKE